MVRRPVRFHLNPDASKSGLQRYRAPELLHGGIGERLRLLLLGGDAEDADGLIGEAVLTRGHVRDLLDDVHAFGDTAEGGELAIERRLRIDADEELGTIAVG